MPTLQWSERVTLLPTKIHPAQLMRNDQFTISRAMATTA
jgi:hypothetical protein